MTSSILYNYASLQAGVDAIKSANSKIENEVSTLISDTKALLAGFTGATADAYNTKSTQISQLFDEQNTALNQIGTNLANNTSNMQTTDSRTAGTFG